MTATKGVNILERGSQVMTWRNSRSCWIFRQRRSRCSPHWEFYADENFGGASMRLTPGTYPNLAPEWTKRIGSFQCVEPSA